jgi:hypothetical protein
MSKLDLHIHSFCAVVRDFSHHVSPHSVRISNVALFALISD